MTLPSTAPAALRVSTFRHDLLDDGDYLTRVMGELGIVQKGHRCLTNRDQRGFDLPRETAVARRVLHRLVTLADRVEERYPFRHGMGLAAPQLGVPRRMALVRTEPFGTATVLINPRVVAAGPVAPDAGFEGCLSFFGVRGRVPRPEWLAVAHQDLDGTRRESLFEGPVAVHVAHELDHLDGILYETRLAPGERLVPLATYRAYGRRPAALSRQLGAGDHPVKVAAAVTGAL